jgi:6-phosphogluconolactonase
VLLGIGTDGHTASLFPGTPALDVVDAWATRGLATYAPVDRITVTFPLINAAGAVAFLVTGESKRAALDRVVAGTVPSARVRPTHGELRWFLDAAAAGE